MFQESLGGRGDFGDGLLERRLIHARWDAIAADFANELQCGFLELLVRRGLVGAAEFFYASAHGRDFTSFLKN